MNNFKPIDAPEPISGAKATEMYTLYNGTFNLAKDNSTNVCFGLVKMREMLEAFEAAGADHVRVYFGAIYNDAGKDGTEPSVQTTVFFQAAMEDPTDSTIIDDVPLDEVSPYDLGSPCPPPRCPGKLNY